MLKDFLFLLFHAHNILLLKLGKSLDHLTNLELRVTQHAGHGVQLITNGDTMCLFCFQFAPQIEDNAACQISLAF